MEYTHGGDILTAQNQYHGPVLDCSANLNLLGMPPAVRTAAEGAVAQAVHYPDPFCRALAAGIAQRDGVRPEHVLCGNGAADLIFRFCFALRPQKAVVTAPTFSEYEQALAAAGCGVAHHLLREEDGFAVTAALLDGLTEDVDVLFLCNPNNPTGRPVDAAVMDRVLEHCREKRIRMVVDECFLELTDGGPGLGLAHRIEEFPNLLLLRAFTKSYAMPGLRLGYCLTADASLMERLKLCAQPWSVSGPAQAAGLAAIGEPDWPAKARSAVAVERPALETGLRELGCTVYPSWTNYLLFRVPGVSDLKERLVVRGVLIRSCANYVGLEPDFYRVCVHTHDNNRRLLAAMKEALGWQKQS